MWSPKQRVRPRSDRSAPHGYEVNRNRRRQICQFLAKSANHLRIPQKGYKVHGVRQSHYWLGEYMLKFVKRVTGGSSAWGTIAGGSSAW